MGMPVLEQIEGREYLSIEETADLLDISYDAAYKWVINGTLPSVRSGRNYLVEAEAVRKRLMEQHERDEELNRLVEEAKQAENQGMIPPLLTTSHAARLKGVKPNTITGWIRSGKLAAQRAGRVWVIHPAALKSFNPDQSESLQ